VTAASTKVSADWLIVEIGNAKTATAISLALARDMVGRRVAIRAVLFLERLSDDPHSRRTNREVVGFSTSYFTRW
jgi:hypothetical protein